MYDIESFYEAASVEDAIRKLQAGCRDYFWRQ